MFVVRLLLKYCIYCASAPSLHKESTDSLILRNWDWKRNYFMPPSVQRSRVLSAHIHFFKGARALGCSCSYFPTSNGGLDRSAESFSSKCAIIGASLSEPHTSEFNGGIFMYISVVRRSVNAS